MTRRLVLVRHGQSVANVARRLDTRPPGAALTDLGREQARAFARARPGPPGLLVHSVAHRAAQTAAEIATEFAAEFALAPAEAPGIHEVQAGELEDRADEEAIAEFNRIYRLWHTGDLDVPMPGGESGRDVLDRYLPLICELRAGHLDDPVVAGEVVVVSHGAAIRLVAAVLAGVHSGFALENHLANTEAVILVPGPGTGWRCAQWGPNTAPPRSGSPDAVPAPVPEGRPAGDPMG